MKNKRLIELLMLFVVAALVSAMATGSHAAEPAAKAPAAATSPAAAAASLSSGEVRQIDKTAGKITIKHGPLVNLDMPAMTMAFKVKDPAVLDRFKSGDRVAFVAEQQNGALIVTRIEASK